MNIQSMLKNANTVLFTDSDYFNKNITGVKNLKDIKDMFCIKGRLIKTDIYSNCICYKLSNSDYNFTLKFL